ncbi:hypothetical protein VZT92_022956 [Zoarces viviparus]|uniref:SET domain-containing protein n=1 Tax=Zoarces viviparus TaxID=48416 RepID=A0AAW1E5V0_ZOAVI
MKRNTPEERATELQKMNSSSRKWVRESRTWDYKFLCEIVPHRPSHFALLKEFLERGFLVNNQPHEADMDLGDAPASTSATAAASSGPDSSNQSSPSSSDRDGGPSDPTWQESSPEKAGQRDQTSPPQDVHKFSDFLAAFPVTVDGKPPTKKQRIDAGFPENRVFDARWRANQYRGQYLLSISRDGVQAYGEGRMGGQPHRGVVATRPFSKGDIVWRTYHGEVITADEEKKKMEALKNQPGYMFFFKSGDRALCIDAHTHPCKCHTNLETVGRRINHSCKKANLKPLQCVLKVDREGTHVILFQTLKDIKVDEELRFDYEVQRKSFRGEDLL